MDVAVLVLRLFVGLLLVGHGTQKLFGWFGGHGIAGTGGFMESIGFRPGKLMALLAATGELVGGGSLALGLLTPLGGAATIAVMLNATVPHWGKGPFANNGGWELAGAYAVVGGTLAFVGPGTISLDHAFGWHLTNTGWGVAATIVGLAAAGLNLGVRAIGQRSHGNAGGAQPA